MNNINQITSVIFNELGKNGKSVTVHSEGNVLVIKLDKSETRILNWQTTPVQSILETAKSLTLKENFGGDILLHG
jgi:hypothetical protein